MDSKQITPINYEGAKVDPENPKELKPIFINEEGKEVPEGDCLCIMIEIDSADFDSSFQEPYTNPFISDTDKEPTEPKKVFLWEWLSKKFIITVKKNINNPNDEKNIIISATPKPFLLFVKNITEFNKPSIEKKIKDENYSSIWFRWCKNDSEVNSALEDFAYFKSLHLYDYDSAKENFDYSIRLLNENHLFQVDGGGGHYGYITPILHGDETKSRETLLKNCFEADNESKNKHEKDVTYKFFNEFHDVTMRILVVDDKVGDCELCDGTKTQKKWHSIINEDDKSPASISIIECSECSNKQCKLKTLKQLMDDGKNTTKEKIFEGIGGDNDYFYWKEENIKTYYCPDVILDFIDDPEEQQKLDGYTDIQVIDAEKDKTKANQEKSLVIKVGDGSSPSPDGSSPSPDGFSKSPKFVDFKSDDTCVQLVGVRDVRTALLLLSRYKFDMIFFDYLLEKKKEKSSDRDYSIQFFEFLTGNIEKKTKKEISNPQQPTSEDKNILERAKILESFRRAVLDNRGPLDRFWIMPITGFNETFIADLSRNGIPLIGSKWHINNGADPITTPWQFLDKLNRFIELQLTGSLFTFNKLMTFLQYTGEELESKFHVSEEQKGKIGFEEFHAFLAAEYSSFFSKYGSKAVIKRDATVGEIGESAITTDDKKDLSSKSVFATYVWKYFYRKRPIHSSDNEEKKKKMLFSLHSHMLEFYQTATIMRNDHHGMLMLRESFRRLRYFIDVYRLVDEYVKDVEESRRTEIINGFKKSIGTIANCIDLVESGKNSSNY